MLILSWYFLFSFFLIRFLPLSFPLPILLTSIAPINVTTQEEYIKADAFILVYSCVDKASYTRVEQLLMTLQDLDLIRTRPVIIVANKIDLARSRAVSSQGLLLLKSY